MKISHRTVHLVSLMAVMIGLWSPIFTLPVMAATEPPQPAVSLNTDDGSGLSTPESDQPRAVPVLPELIAVVPVMPTLADAACADGAVHVQTAVEVATEGVGYDISSPDETGAFVVTATLTDASVYIWASGGMQGWEVSGNTATSSGVVALCPESEPDTSVPPATAAADTPDESQTDGGEIELANATAEADKPDESQSDEGEIELTDATAEASQDDSTDELGAPTTGRGPARELSDSQRMSINAADSLTISKSASPVDGVTIGSTITYTITVTNDTGADQYYTIEDALPAGVSFVAATVPYSLDGDYCTPTGGVVTCGLDETMRLYSGWADVWSITVEVNDGAANETTCPTGLVNVVTGDWEGSASANSMFAEDLCQPSLSFTFEAETAEITRNDQRVAFTITITNTSAVAATDVSFLAHLSVLGFLGGPDWEVSKSSGAGTCLASTIVNCIDLVVPAREGGVPGSLTVSFAKPAGADYPSTVCTTHDVPVDFMHSSLDATLTLHEHVTITCDVRWEMDISVDKSIVAPGETVTYSFLGTNLGNGTYERPGDTIIFEYFYPEGFEKNDDTVFGTNLTCESVVDYSDNNGHSCMLPADTVIGPGETFSIDIPLKVIDSLSPDDCPDRPGFMSTYNFSPPRWFSFSYSGPPPVQIDCDPGVLEVNLDGPTADVEIGEVFYYFIGVSNGSDVLYDGTHTWTLTLPKGVVLVEPVESLSADCALGSENGFTTLTCSETKVLSPHTGTGLGYRFVVTPTGAAHICQGVDAGDSTTFTATQTGIGDDWNPEQNTASVTNTITCDTRLVMTVTADPEVVNPGETVAVTYSVISSTSDFDNMTFLAEFSTTPDPGSGSENHRIGCAVGSLLWSCYLTQPDPEQSGPLFVKAFFTTPTDPSNEVCENGVTSTATWIDGSLDTANSQLAATYQINCQQLSLAKVVSADSVPVGEEFAYTVSVTNNGRNSHGTYAFTDALPPGIELADANAIVGPDGTTCTPTLAAGISTITCNSDHGPLAQRDHQYTFRVKSNYALDTAACDEVTSTATGTDGIWIMDSDAISTNIECVSRLEVTKSALQSPVIPGEAIGYEITVENTGDTTIATGTIADVLPQLPGDGEWSYMVNGVPVDVTPFPYTLTNFAKGDSMSFRMVSSEIPTNLQVPESEWCGEWENTVAVSGISDNGVDVGSSQTATVRVNCTGLTIDTQVSAPVIEPGDAVTYTITVTNLGNTTVEPLMAGIQFLPELQFGNWSVSGDAENSDCELTGTAPSRGAECSFLSLGKGETATVTITGDAVEIPTVEQCEPVDTTGWFSYSTASDPNMVVFQDGLTPPETIIEGEAVTAQINCQPGVEISRVGEIDTGDDDRVDAGDTITYTIDVFNSGNMALYDIVVTDSMSGLVWDRDLTVAELLPGERVMFTAVYIITQADVDSGQLVHTASVTAALVPGSGDAALQFIGLAQSTQPFPVLTDSVSNDVTATLVLNQEPGIDLSATGEANTGDDGELNLGDTITYRYTVTNSGNVTMTDFELGTDMDGLVFADGTSIASLAPGDEATLTATYTVTDADVAAGAIEMCADVSAIDPGSALVTDADRCVRYAVAQPLPITPTPTSAPSEPTPTPTSSSSVTPTPASTSSSTPTAVPTSQSATPEPATPEPATPEPATPAPATPDPETPAAVTSLPETGFGGLAGLAPVLGLTLIIAMLLLAVGAAGVRRKE